MSEFLLKGLRLPPDLYSMIDSECKRREELNVFWPGVYPVIIDALYSYFDFLRDCNNKEDF